jgi:DNA-binding PadR family transcriptional regulator
MAAHAWRASHSQIYPELARLQERGLVGGRPRRAGEPHLGDH